MRLRDFQQDFNKKLAIRTGLAGLTGLKWPEIFGTLGEIVESIQNRKTRAFLNSALEFLKPHHLALGLRISRLSTTHVEIVVPKMAKSLSSSGELDPGVVTSAALLAVELLMRRMGLDDLGELSLDDFTFNRNSPMTGEVRGRLEFGKLSQEAFRAELRKLGKSQLNLQMSFFDQDEKRVADFQGNFSCSFVQKLAWNETT